MSTQARYRVSLAGPPMRLGALGTAGTSYCAFDDKAASKAEAVEKARAIARSNGFASYADGKATVEVMHTYAVTLRGKTDKRRRETFMLSGADEREVLNRLQYHSAASRFAGYGIRAERTVKRNGRLVRVPDDRIIKIEEVA